MAEDAGTAPAESGDTGQQAQPISIDIPTDFEANEVFKPFFVEADGAKKFDFQALTKSYLETKQAIPVVPETAEAYAFEFPKDYSPDEADLKLTREMAKAVGMTQAQFEAVMKNDLARMTRAADEIASNMAKAKDALQTEWKQNFERNMGMAKKAADVVFGAGFSDRIDIGNDPQIIKGLHKIASMMSEDTLKQGGLPSGDTRPLGEDGKPRLKFKSMGD